MSFCRLRPNVVFRQALFAYVHTLRAFNGDWRWDPLQAAVGTSDNNKNSDGSSMTPVGFLVL